jgi:hypothetical protein
MDRIGPLLLFLAGLVAAGFGAQYVRGLFFAGPRRFKYGEETFIQVPDESGDHSFFSPQYEHGDFQYADGTPVTDYRLYRMLQDYWVRQNQPTHND